MFGLDDVAGGVLDIGKDLIDKIFPDKQKAAEAKAKLMLLEQHGELAALHTRMSAIIAEAQSKDPWTSRARPSFLYVMYIMILAAIPMGVLAAFNPATAAAIANGMKAWLAAIPSGLWATFGIGYSGYAVARSMDKKNVLKSR